MGERRRFGSITEFPDGSFRGRYRVRGKDYYTPRKSTKKAVQADLTKAEAAILAGTWAAPTPRRVRTARTALPSGPLFVEEFGKAWLQQLEGAGRSPNTLRSYRSNLKAHITPAMGSRRIRDLTDADIDALYARMANHAPGTRLSVGRTLSALISAAPEADRPAKKLSILRGAGGRRRTVERRALTAAELGLLVAATSEPLRAAVALAGWCSLRSGEISGLRRGDVDVEAWTVTVGRAVKRDEKGRPALGPPKSAAGYRAVSIPPQAREVVAAHLSGSEGGADAPLFPGSWGGFLSDRVLRRAVREAALAAGIPAVTVHELRHTGLTLYGQAGATLADLMARAGHTSAETVMIYQHSSAVRDRELAARMGG